MSLRVESEFLIAESLLLKVESVSASISAESWSQRAKLVSLAQRTESGYLKAGKGALKVESVSRKGGIRV